jgi:hypothetical protein
MLSPRIHLVGVAVLCACASQKPAEKMSAQEAFSSAPEHPAGGVAARPTLGTPQEWASQYRRDVECELAARDLKVSYGEDIAWKYLTKGCVPRGVFTQLRALLDNWTQELLTRPEAGSLLAEIVAKRGGIVPSDLTMIQQKRIPLFDLNSAVSQANAFKGRYLLLTGKITQIKSHKGRTELAVDEVAAASQSTVVMSHEGRTGSSSARDSSASAEWKSNGIMGSGSASGKSSTSGFSQSGGVEDRVSDYFKETGQEAIIKLKQPDPFLRTERTLVFLVRFDGTAISDNEDTGESEEPRKVALVTLVSYHEI